MPRPGYTKVTVELAGPLFTQDVSRVFGDNLILMLDQAAQEQATLVRQLIDARAGSMPYFTGHSRDTVRGRVRSLSGKKWHYHAVVSADTSGMSKKDAIATKAAAASIENRWHPFRRVKSASYRAIGNANLTRGLE